MSTLYSQARDRIKVLEKALDAMDMELAKTQAALRRALSSLRSYDKPLADHIEKSIQ